jgi:CHASE2 domain-containing sensor protein
MRSATGLRRRVALLVAVAVGAGVLGVVAYSAHALRPLELSSIDTRFTLRGTRRAPDVVIVAIDDATLNGLQHNFPFPRRRHAQVIDKLRLAGARAIGYDVEFIHPTDDADDNALILAAARARGIVLATTEVGAQGQTLIFGGGSILRQIGARAGNASIRADPDGVFRRLAYSEQGLTTFPVVLAEQALHAAVAPSEFPGGSVPIDFAGPPGTIKTISFLRVLRGQFPPDLFRGKVVVVGVTAPTYQDLHDTAVSHGTPMTGAELQANGVETVLQGNPLRDASGGLNGLLIVALGIAVPLAATRLRLGYLIGLALALGVLYLLATQLAFDSGTILSVVYPILALVLGTVGSIAADLFLERRQRETLESTGRVSDFFISYRRDQSAWPARILRDALTKRFGEGSVFMDLESIEAGADWPRRIDDAISACGAILVLIGPHWLDARDRHGERRIDDPADWVRLEIEAALRQPDIVLAPVLLDGAAMPAPEELPESIRTLTNRNSIAITADAWGDVVDRVVDSIGRGRIRDHLSQTRATPHA